MNNLFTDMKKYVCSRVCEWYEFPLAEDLANCVARAKFLLKQHRYIYEDLNVRPFTPVLSCCQH